MIQKILMKISTAPSKSFPKKSLLPIAAGATTFAFSCQTYSLSLLGVKYITQISTSTWLAIPVIIHAGHLTRDLLAPLIRNTISTGRHIIPYGKIHGLIFGDQLNFSSINFLNRPFP